MVAINAGAVRQHVQLDARGSLGGVLLGAWTSGLTGRNAILASVPLVGGLLLGTFLLVGRPPVSPPTLTGLLVFGALAIVAVLAIGAEAVALGRVLTRPPAFMPALLGYAPTAAGWPLVGALYHPEVHHWFATVESVRPAMFLALLVPTLALKVGMAAFTARQLTLAWISRHKYVLAGALYASLAVAAKPSLWHIDLPGWFVPAAKLVLAGNPLAIYSVRADVMGTSAPLEHGPLTVLLYAPFVAFAELAGKTDFLRVGALFPLLGVLAVDCLMAYVVTRAVHDLSPRLSEPHRFGLFVLILFSPLLWFSSVWLVHLESLNALLIICAVRQLGTSRGRDRSAVIAGVCLGAALLLKHSAALAAGPLLLALFVFGWRRATLIAGATAAFITVVGLAPFAIAAPADFLYNFSGYDAVKPIYGLTIWKASYDSGIEPLIMRLDSLFIALLALGSAWAVGHVLRAQGVDPRRGAWIAIVLGQLSWLSLATWQYPHYFVLGFVALLIWETSTQRVSNGGTASWPVLSLLFLFVPYNLQAHFPGNVGKAGGAFVVVRAAAQALFLYGCALAVWMRADGAHPSGAGTSAEGPSTEEHAASAPSPRLALPG